MGRRIVVTAMANCVRARRVAGGFSQRELAESCGLTRQGIAAIEAGQYIPNTAVALKLARRLGCDVETLFTLPSEADHVEAELLTGATSVSERELRVQVARVGDRLLATPLHGGTATATAADGLATGSPAGDAAGPARQRISVELLTERAQLERTVVVRGCDPAFALLGAHLSRRYPSLRLIWIHQGSLEALRALGRGEAHAAGSHLRDPQTGICNVPYVERELEGRRLVIITLSEWQEGLIVARGNPKGIRDVASLAQPNVTIVNREPGSGSRLLLDTALARGGIAPAQLRGYDREALSHYAVAETIAAGAADAGPGIRSVARAFELDIIPLGEQRHDLVIPHEFVRHPPLQALLDVAVSRVFRRELEALGGYDSSRAGAVAAELGGARRQGDDIAASRDGARPVPLH